MQYRAEPYINKSVIIYRALEKKEPPQLQKNHLFFLNTRIQ